MKLNPREVLASVPRSDDAPQSEQQALYEALCTMVPQYEEAIYVDVVLQNISLQHRDGVDRREVFRSYISALPAQVTLPFIRSVYSALEARGVELSSSYIDVESILEAEKIFLATNHLLKDSAPVETMPERVKEMIYYALVQSDDIHATVNLIKERKPLSMDELLAIEKERRDIEPALQVGVL